MFAKLPYRQRSSDPILVRGTCTNNYPNNSIRTNKSNTSRLLDIYPTAIVISPWQDLNASLDSEAPNPMEITRKRICIASGQ